VWTLGLGRFISEPELLYWALVACLLFPAELDWKVLEDIGGELLSGPPN
jgi:hypothetical protein